MTIKTRKKTINVTTYIAEDGKKFDKENDCLAYEAKCWLKKHEVAYNTHGWTGYMIAKSECPTFLDVYRRFGDAYGYYANSHISADVENMAGDTWKFLFKFDDASHQLCFYEADYEKACLKATYDKFCEAFNFQ
jgi:hypothetical protein